MTHDELEKMRSLVDDLCLLTSGWRTDGQHDDYKDALDRVARHGAVIKHKLEIERLKARIEELDGNALKSWRATHEKLLR